MATRVSSSTSLTRRGVAVDLFAGVGGFSLAAERAGFDVVAAVEYDPVHASAHHYNFPRTAMLCSDMATLTKREAKAAINEGLRLHGRDRMCRDDVDVVVGGPPCQGFSEVGRRERHDQRNAQVLHFADVIMLLRPKYFVLENVPGLLRAVAPISNTSMVGMLVRRLARGGYVVADPLLLDAAAFAVPQRRRRAIIVGWRNDQREPHLLFNGERGTVSVIEAIQDLPNADEFEQLLSEDEVRLPSTLASQSIARASVFARHARSLARSVEDLAYPRPTNQLVLTASRRTLHNPNTIARFGSTSPGAQEPHSRLYRLSGTDVATTLRAGTGYERGSFTSPRPIHPNYPRVITVREAGRLHGFPDWFRFNRTKWHGFREVGNAIPPQLGQAVLGRIADALALAPEAPSTPVPLGDPSTLAFSMRRAADYWQVSLNGRPSNACRYRKGSHRRAAA